MKDFFRKDSMWLGLATGLGSAALTAVLLWIGIVVAGEQPSAHLRWFGACFVAPVLLLRHYAKAGKYPVTVKTIIVTLFLTFVAFMYVNFQCSTFDLK